MSKLRLTEAQVGMIQQRIEDLEKKKVLKVNEGQYDRLFKGGFNKASQSISKNLKKGGIKEDSEKPELNPLEFAQELIVFIKDVIANPKRVPFSAYWENIGISRKELFMMLKKADLLTMMVGEGNVKTYKAKKIGFRKGVIEMYKQFSENQLNEVGYEGGGYPAGAEDDPRNPINDPMHTDNGEGQGEIVDNKTFEQVYYSEHSDDLMILKHSNDLYVFISANVDEEAFRPFQDMEGIVDEKAIINYVNAKWNKEEKVFGEFNRVNDGQIVKIGPEVAQKLIGLYGNDGEMVNILNQLPESTGASSSGSFVGGMSGAGPIQKDTGMSPEQAMQDISEVIDAEGVAPFHSERSGEGKFVIDGVKWQYVNVTNNGKVELGVYRYGQDIAYSYDWFSRNILKKDLGETTSMGGAGGINVGNGGDSIEHDVNAFGSSNFMQAGNKLNKEEAMPMVKRQIGESIQSDRLANDIQSAIANVDESLSYQDFGIAVANVIKNSYGQHLIKPFLKVVTSQLGQSNDHLGEGIEIGQIYKNGNGRAKIINIIDSNSMEVRTWGNSPAKNINIGVNELGGWTLMEGKKVLKLSEAQLKRVLGSDNKTSTEYPNGEMVDFDDCTKLNNNKVAQNGGCSQGDDGVVNLTKTKDSVVSKKKA